MLYPILKQRKILKVHVFSPSVPPENNTICLRYKYQNSKVYLYVQGCLCAPFLLDYLLFVHIQCVYIFFQDRVRQRQV